MLSAILSIIAYLLPLVMEGIKQAQLKQKGADHDANIQELRRDLGKGDRPRTVAALADQHDRVQSALRSS